MAFSVIIPTLQRSELLATLMNGLIGERLVDEIIVINNAPEPLTFESEKVRVLNQKSNIFVNPAWNLGVEQSSAPLLCIANDDITFDMSLFRFARRALRLPIGILAPAPSCYARSGVGIPADQPPDPGRLKLLPVYRRTFGFGSLMFMRRDAWTPIPDDLLIWYGDDHLFEHQRRRNVIFSGFPITTPMSATAGDPTFQHVQLADRAAFLNHPRGDYDRRFGHEVRAFRGAARWLKRRSHDG